MGGARVACWLLGVAALATGVGAQAAADDEHAPDMRVVVTVYYGQTLCHPTSEVARAVMYADGACNVLVVNGQGYRYNLTFDASAQVFTAQGFASRNGEACAVPNTERNDFACGQCLGIPPFLVPGAAGILFINATCPNTPAAAEELVAFRTGSTHSAPVLSRVAIASCLLAACVPLAVCIVAGLNHAGQKGGDERAWTRFSLFGPQVLGSPSLCLRVPPRQRAALTLALVVCLMLVCFGVSAKEAELHLTAEIDEEPLQVFNRDIAFGFDLYTSIKLMWENDSRTFAAILALTSLFWPLFKLAILSVLWVAPVSKGTLGAVLFWLDISGKWAVMNVFCIALFVNVMDIEADFGEGSEKNPPYLVRMAVETREGLYLFVVGCMLLIVITQTMLWFYRTYRPPSNHRMSMSKKVSQNLREFKVFQSNWTVVVVALCAVVSATLMVAAFVVDFVEVEYSGALGNQYTNYTLGGDNQVLSLVDIGAGLVSSHYHDGRARAGFLAFAYFAFALVLPIITVLVIFVLLVQHRFGKAEGWGGRRARRAMLRVMDLSMSWAAVDVLFVMGALSGGAYEDLLNSLLQDLQRDLEQILNAKSSLTIQINLLPRAWLMLAAVLLSYLVCGALISVVKWSPGGILSRQATMFKRLVGRTSRNMAPQPSIEVPERDGSGGGEQAPEADE